MCSLGHVSRHGVGPRAREVARPRVAGFGRDGLASREARARGGRAGGWAGGHRAWSSARRAPLGVGAYPAVTPTGANRESRALRRATRPAAPRPATNPAHRSFGPRRSRLSGCTTRGRGGSRAGSLARRLDDWGRLLLVRRETGDQTKLLVRRTSPPRLVGSSGSSSATRGGGVTSATATTSLRTAAATHGARARTSSARSTSATPRCCAFCSATSGRSRARGIARAGSRAARRRAGGVW